MGNLLTQVCCIEKDSNYSKHITNLKYQSNIPDNSHLLSDNYSPSSEMYLTSPSSTTSAIHVSTLIRQNKGHPKTNYITLTPIGNGSFGNVIKIMHKSTGLIRSMKTIPKDNLKEGFTDDEIQREITILKSLNHPHIIKLFEFYVDDNNYYLINEYCDEGDLSDKLISSKYFEEHIVKSIMFQIFTAVLYLHSQNIIHGDLKLENVLINSIKRQYDTNTSTNNNVRSQYLSFDVKLIDFGCSKIFTHYKKQFEDIIGTTMYSSPEVLRNSYDEKCDVWSCGVIMYILLSGEVPFYGHTENETASLILNGHYSFNSKAFDNISTEAKDLISKCFTYNKAKRISIKEALQHEFFTKDNNAYITHTHKTTIIHIKPILISFLNIKTHSILHQAVLTFLSHNYADKKEIDLLNKVFYSIDCDMDGKISYNELQQAYDKYYCDIKISNNELNNIINCIGLSRNGYIEYGEFIMAALSNKEELFCDINLKAAFDVFDLDKNGIITMNELMEVLGNVDLIQLKENVFRNGIEGITFEYFKEIILM